MLAIKVTSNHRNTMPTIQSTMMMLNFITKVRTDLFANYANICRSCVECALEPRKLKRS